MEDSLTEIRDREGWGGDIIKERALADPQQRRDAWRRNALRFRKKRPI